MYFSKSKSQICFFTKHDPKIRSSHKIIVLNMKKALQPAVLLWILFSLICGFLVSQAQFTADMSAFLPRKPSQRQQLLIDQISEGAASRSLIVSIEGVPSSVLANLSIAMGQELRGLPDFKSVSNGQREANQKDQELLFNNRYLLSPMMTESRMTTQGLRAAVQENLAEISSSAGLFSKSLLGKDPTGETLEILKRVIPADQPSLTDGVWMNTHSTKALLLLQTNAQGSDLDALLNAHQAVTRSFEAAKNKIGEASAKAILKYSGPSVFAVNSRDSIKSEAAYLSTVGTLMVLGLLWIVYRSITTLFLGMIPVVTGAIAGIAAVSLGFSSVHGMTVGFGITLIGEAVDYAIYLFVQYMPDAKLEVEKDAPNTPSFSKSFWPTIRLGVLTSIVGFSTMLFSGFTGLAQLGLFSIVGIVIAALTTRFVLPVLLPKNFHVRQPEKLGVALVKVVNKLMRLKIVILLITAIAIVFLATRGDTLWSMELGGLSPVANSAQKLDADLRAELGAPDAGMLIVLKALSSESALQLSEKVSARLEPLVTSGVLGGFQSPSNYLPSQQTQLARKKSIPADAELKSRMATALEGLPLNVKKLNDFFTDIAAARLAQPIKREDLNNTSLSLGVDSLMMQESKAPQAWTALIVLQPPVKNGVQQSLDAKKINAALASMIVSGASNPKPDVFLIELKTEVSNLYKAYLGEAVQLTLIGFLAIITLLFVTLRSGLRVFRVIAPLLVSVALVAATLVMLKGNLNLLHLIGLLLVIAIGSNYALFFDQRTDAQLNTQPSTTSINSEHSLLSSLFFANLTTVLGFGILSFSSVPVMNSLGTTVSLGAFLALVLSASFAMPQKNVCD
jgi:predicted exporter